MYDVGKGVSPMNDISFFPAGDSALVAEFGREIDAGINAQVHAMAAWITARRLRGVREVLPTFRSLMVYYDPLVVSYGHLVRQLSRFSGEEVGETGGEREIVEVPCCYDGPDLADMQTLTGLTADEIIAIHSAVDYRIYMMGFLPGFVYLGGLDPRIHAPRLQTPRTRIEPGSVGIGGSQTGIYPVASPGGWRILGRTPLKLYDPARSQPILCRAGQFIRFVPISASEYERLVDVCR